MAEQSRRGRLRESTTSPPPGRLGRRAALLVAAMLAVAGAVAAIPAQRVAAQEQCTQNTEDGGTDNTGWDCNWTQMENSWPDGSSDPDCHDQCAYWLHGQCSNSYDTADQINYGYTFDGHDVDFHGDMARAVKSWSGEPYCSPFLYPCNCGSSTVNLQAFDMNNPNYCGEGTVVTAWQANGQQYDNHVVSAWAAFNTNIGNAPWYDGPPPNYTGEYCDAVSTALHEMGHAMTEGHSSIPSDLMCSNDAGCEEVDSIDGDAEAMLDAVYGPYHSSNNSGGSGGCNGCQMACPQTTNVAPASSTVDPIGTANQTVWTVCGTTFALPQVDGYYAKAWDLYFGVPHPAIPSAASLLTPEGCQLYLNDVQLVPWLDCVTAAVR